MAETKKYNKVGSLQPNIDDILDWNSLPENAFEPATESEKENFIQERENIKFVFQRLPLVPVQPVDQIKVDMVRFQAGELFLKHGSWVIIGTLHSQSEQLGGDMHFVPQMIIFKNLPQGDFRMAVVIRVGGVVIVDAVFHGICNHLLCHNPLWTGPGR